MTQLTIDTTRPHSTTLNASHFIWAGRSLVECKVTRDDTDTHADLFVHTTESAIREALFRAAQELGLGPDYFKSTETGENPT